MGEAMFDSSPRVVDGLQRALIHGLQQEMRKVEMLERGRLDLALRINELQLIARTLHEIGAGLRAHADPIDGTRHWQRSVGLDGDLEAGSVQGVNQRLINL